MDHAVTELTSNTDDLDVCASLMANSHPWRTLGWSHAECLDSVKQPTIRVHGTRADDGTISSFIATMKHGMGLAPFVAGLCVAERHRGWGLGTKLMHFFTDELFPDANHLYVCVSDINPRAMDLYIRLGYLPVGAYPNHHYPGQTEFLLRFSRGAHTFDVILAPVVRTA